MEEPFTGITWLVFVRLVHRMIDFDLSHVIARPNMVQADAKKPHFGSSGPLKIALWENSRYRKVCNFR